MPRFLQWLGLNAIEKTDEYYERFCAYVASKSTAIYGYYGLPYFNCHLGRAQFIIRTMKTEDSHRYEMAGLDSHGRGNSIWDVYATGADFTPPNADKLVKRIAVSTMDKKHLAVVNLVNADVLPCYLAGEQIKMQMLAYPISFEYFPDEEAFNNRLREKGHAVDAVRDGQIVPIALLSNKNTENGENNQPPVDLALLRATVKGFLDGSVALGEEETHRYLRCLVDTDFGELEIVHMLDQVPEDQWDNLRAGAVIWGTFVLSGDVAIYDYEEGIIRDHEHNLKLLRSVLQGDDTARLISILAEDVEYISDFTQEKFMGKDEIVNRFNYVKDGAPLCYAYPATIVSIDSRDDSPAPIYDIGTRCLILAYEEPHRYESFAFIEVNEEGYITRIHTSYDDRYRFRIDGIEYKTPEPEPQETEE